jgi:HNH endonuclease
MRLTNSQFTHLVGTASHLRARFPDAREKFASILRRSDPMIPPRLVETVWLMTGCVGPDGPIPRQPLHPLRKVRVIHRGRAVCPVCRRPFSVSRPPEVGHLIPVRLGGSNAPRNLAALCLPCNRTQGGGLLALEAYARIWKL